MGPWDLAGRKPSQVIDMLRGLGLDACNLALAYHGGRMLLPTSPRGLVHELHPGAIYFTRDKTRFPGPLQPEMAPEACLTGPFLEACREREFPVYAWTVVCHNDRLGALAPIENVFGERYNYALCPANPAVRDYAAALCGAVASLPGIAGIDLEAAGYMGYEHAGLHDKRGLPLPAAVVFLLSVCMCSYCSALMGGAAGEIRREAVSAIRRFLAGEADHAVPPHPALLEARRIAQRELLLAIRTSTAGVPVNLRLSCDPMFAGGKSTLQWQDLRGLADTATVTFFGTTRERMAAELRNLPPPAARPLPVWGGYVFHGPDCGDPEDVAGRLALLETSELAGGLFYSFSLAATWHFEWLRRALAGASKE